jgi:CDP-glycerol glycerophosphotransferase
VHVLPAAAADGRFTAVVAPARVPSLAGVLPLGQGTWRMSVRSAPAAGDRGEAPLVATPAVFAQLAAGTAVGHKHFSFAALADGSAALVAERDLAEDERGPYHQRRLRASVYAAGRDAPVRDAVIYSSFAGRQYSDSPRAIHEELVRRGAPVEHLWVVRDGACEVPATATVVRKGSREYYDALARSRFVVTNDSLPAWFRRREDQCCVQTLHGTPLRRVGFDVAANRGKARRLLRGLDEQVANWQYVVSANPYATGVLRGAYGLEEGLIETGLPRADQLAGPDREERERRVRERLGVPAGARVVLYAPTYRDDAVDRRGRYRLDLRVDLEQVRRAAGDDAIVLFRRHPFITDASPTSGNGRVRDVSAYPDGTELLLAADVLVTDYSSMMVDFANTGRPMLFFAYDLEAYDRAVHGFYVDLPETVPGPVLRTMGELTDALRDPDAACAGFAPRYERFVATFCPLDDGHAAARVVDRVFPWRAADR